MAVLQPEDWIKPDNLTLLTAWARDGLIDKEIAEKMNISPPTLYKYKKMFPQIVEALRKGKELVDVEVENALYKKALGYNVPVQKAFKVKDIVYNENGKKISETERIEYAEEEIHIPADTTAQIFWLKNRKRKEWRDKVEYETNNDELNKVKELLSKISDEAKNG